MKISDADVCMEIEEQLSDIGETDGDFLLMPPLGCGVDRFKRICRDEFGLNPQSLDEKGN